MIPWLDRVGYSPSVTIRNVSFPDFGRKVRIIAVLKPILDLADVFEEFIVSVWAIKSTF